ncbi:MAG: acyl carrier protein [Chthoniobacterales bacterium]
MSPLPETAILEKELFDLISTRLLKIPPGFGVEANLLDVGFDSMTVMQLLVLIEEKYGITLADEDLLLENFQSTTALATLLRTTVNK